MVATPSVRAALRSSRTVYKQTTHWNFSTVWNFESTAGGFPVCVAAGLASILLYGHLFPRQNQPQSTTSPERHPAGLSLKPWQQAVLRIMQPAVLSWQRMSRGHPPRLKAWVLWR